MAHCLHQLRCWHVSTTVGYFKGVPVLDAAHQHCASPLCAPMQPIHDYGAELARLATVGHTSNKACLVAAHNLETGSQRLGTSASSCTAHKIESQ